MKKKGFTLVELTAVVIILALVSILGFSYINNVISTKKDDLSDAFNKIVVEAAKIYVSYNPNNYMMEDGNLYCIKLSELIDYELLSSPLIDPVTNKQISEDKFVKMEVNVDEYLYSIVDTCTEKR